MASTYLNRNASATATTFTYSVWLKRSGLASDYQYFFSYQSSGGGSNGFGLAFNGSTNKMYYYGTGGTATTDAVFRDTAAWYHVVLSVSSGTGTLYVNNETVKSSIAVNQVTSGEGMTIGAYKYGSTIDYEFDGYMSELHFTDGTAYAPTTFGETDTTGVWVPKVGPTVTYGTNGFYLKFANSGAMGTDSSGNSNTFSVGGGTVRQVPDSPTNVFPTLNPLVAVSPIPTLSQGNLESTPSGNGNHTTGATQFMPEDSGKWYAETVLTYVSEQSGAFTIQDPNNIKDSIASYSGQYSVLWQASGTDYYATHDGSSATNSTNATISVGDIFQIAYDSDNGKVWFGRNNTWITGNPSTDATPTYSSITGDKVFTTTGYRVSSGSSYTAQLVNFGQDSSFGGNKTAQNNADANGKGDFYYAPPTGFLALCTDNLSSALTIPVNNGSSAFHAQLYTGTGSARTITNDANSGDFQPDWVWAKQRNDTTAHSHNLVDAIRGGTKTMYTNTTDGQETITQGITGFATDGFTLGTGAAINNNNINYVAWQWKAGGTAPANTYAVKVVSDTGNKYRFDDYGTSAITLELQEGGTFTFDQSDASNAGHPIRFSTTSDGTHGGGSEYTTGVTTNGTPGQAGAYTRITVAASAPTLYYYCSVHSGMGGQANTGSLFGFTNVKGSIQSVVSPNSTAGFSIVSYTGTGSDATVGHGLGKEVAMVIEKRRSGTDDWVIYHKELGKDKYIVLNNSNAEGSLSNFWGTSTPNSTVFGLLGGGYGHNKSGSTHVAYCFAEIEGYSKFDSYTGNGSSDGTFVYTGFRPAYLMTRRTSAGSDGWAVFDSARDPYNGMQYYEFINNGGAEGSGTIRLDFLSNGFKWRQSGSSWNGSGEEFIYMAFAENPLVTSAGTPVTAR